MKNKLDIFEIIHRFYESGSLAYKVLLQHSICVAKKALDIASIYSDDEIDKQFIYEASMLHDIGIIKVDSEEIGCFGKFNYICHGYLGRDMLDEIGLHRHGLVCERHTGVGLPVQSIIKQSLPIPHRDMVPLSLEEKVVSFADLFFSKNPNKLFHEKSIEDIKKGLAKFGDENVKIFEEWCIEFQVKDTI